MPFSLSHPHIAQPAVIFPILFIPLQVHPYSLFQTVLPMLIYSYPYVSISASIVFFSVPPDFSFQQECSPDGLSDCTQPAGLEHGARLHTRSARTKPRVSRGRRNRYPQTLNAPLQGRYAVTGSDIAKSVF